MINSLAAGILISLALMFVILLKLVVVDRKLKSKDQGDLLTGLVVAASLFILLAFIFQIVFIARLFKKIPEKDHIADAIEGLMNPFIAISAVIVTGLAFYAQYKANKQIAEQHKWDKFESQFYEMLRLHKENVNEMIIEGYEKDHSIDQKDVRLKYIKATKDKGNNKETTVDPNLTIKDISGRKVFYLMLKEFKAIYCVLKKIYILQGGTQLIHQKEYIFEKKDKHIADIFFRLAYTVFFHGKNDFIEEYNSEELMPLKEIHPVTYLNRVKHEFEILRTCHKQGVRYIREYIKGGKKSEVLEMTFSYKPFGGHQIRFPHYYRHMFSMVKHVVTAPQDLLTYEDKRRYLKIFRAQLSNHELVLLYYNWLAKFGSEWEQPELEKGNRYFTDYRMLHNINGNLVLKMFSPSVLFKKEQYSNFLYRDDSPDNDLLFELGDSVASKLSSAENQKRKKQQL